MSYGRKRLCLALAVIFLFNIALISLAQSAEAASYKRGSTGSAVSEIQQKLLNWGYYSGEVDGIFGDATEQALLAYQLAYGIEGTHAQVDRLTWANLLG